MNDRLAELKAGGAANPIIQGSAEAPEMKGADLEMGHQGKRGSQYASPGFMDSFFQEVEQVKRNLKQIRAASKQIQGIDTEQNMAVDSKDEAAYSKKMNDIVTQTNKVAKQCKGTLDDMKAETARIKSSSGSEQNELRIRENLVNTLTRKYVETVKEYQKRQQDYKDNVKAKVSRQVHIVKPEASEEDIETLMQDGTVGDVFKNAIMNNVAAAPIQEAAQMAQEKYRDVIRLEESVKELNQMFLDFALLVEQQGELLDQIEYQVHAANDYVQEGNVDIEKAIDLQKSIRKKYCCVIITVLIIAVVIMAAAGLFSG